MKLEAVNGNFMSLSVKVGAKEDVKADELVNGIGDSVDEGLEEGEPLYEGCAAEKEVGGKKKGARKKRSLNWEEAERGLLLEVIKSKVDFVENRNVDAKSVKAKRLAWLQITKQFNALNFRHRSLEQIQVQWRSMKNSAKREYQQKHPKNGPIEGMEMIEFMEELQKDPVSARSQTRGGGGGGGGGGGVTQNSLHELALKREFRDIDDEDTPLASLPTSTNNSEDTIQSSTAALPSPPPSAESQNDTEHAAPPMRTKKKTGPKPHANAAGKAKRQRLQNYSQSEAAPPTATTTANDSPTSSTQNLPIVSIPSANNQQPSPNSAASEDKYKKLLFDLMKRARLAEMDYARREHEQKLRFDQMEQELKMRQLREEHEARMRHCQAEHEARMRVYTGKTERDKQTTIEPAADETEKCI